MQDEELIKKFQKDRNITNDTIATYRVYIKEYSNYYDKTMYELILEAENEEIQGVRWKDRTLKQKLTDYRVYLYNTHALKTARERFHKIKAFYKHFDIEIHTLPKFNEKNVKKPAPVRPEDLPDKTIIRNALEIANPIMKAIILFISSSGCARKETLSLTVEDYIKATKNYHQGGSIYEIINSLNNSTVDVIPIWNVHRSKTNKYYTTFSSNESVTAINNYLLSRDDKLTINSKLFKIHISTFNDNFQNINDALNLGKVGKFNRFRSHMLRKFHASELKGDGMSMDLVNDLQGRSKSITDEAYFLVRTDYMLEEYVKHLPVLLMGKEIEKVTIKSKEFVELESENRDLKMKVNTVQSENQDLRLKVNNVQSEVDEIKRMFDL